MVTPQVLVELLTDSVPYLIAVGIGFVGGMGQMVIWNNRKDGE